MESPAKLVTCLVVDDEEELRDLVGFVLESKFRASIIYAPSGNQAIELIKTHREKLDFIVSDYNMPNGNGGSVFAYLQEQKLLIPFILCSSDAPHEHAEFKDQSPAGFAEKPLFQKPLVEAVGEILKKKPNETTSAPPTTLPSVGDYVRIHIRLLRLANILPCETFIRLGENKYVKNHNSGEPFMETDFAKYQSKNIEYLFIHSSEMNAFMDKLLAEHSGKASSQIPSEPIDSMALALDIEDAIHDIGSKLGFTPELEKMAKVSMSRVNDIVSKNPSLADILKKIDPNSTNYISTHSILLSCVCCWLAHKMAWHSEQTLTKLILASLLHDIALSDQDLAKVQKEEDLYDKKANFSFDAKAQWRSHPTKAAAIATQFSEVPPDVDVIIAQHHEAPHGEGMPNFLNHTKIAPMAALFIIAHDLVASMKFEAHPQELVFFIEKRESLYDVGQFKSILEKILETHTQSGA